MPLTSVSVKFRYSGVWTDQHNSGHNMNVRCTFNQLRWTQNGANWIQRESLDYSSFFVFPSGEDPTVRCYRNIAIEGTDAFALPAVQFDVPASVFELSNIIGSENLSSNRLQTAVSRSLFLTLSIKGENHIVLRPLKQITLKCIHSFQVNKMLTDFLLKAYKCGLMRVGPRETVLVCFRGPKLGSTE